MTHSRRHFLGVTAFLVGSAWGARAWAGQNRPLFPPPPPRDSPFPSGPFDEPPLSQRNRNDDKRMKANQEKITQNMAQLQEAVHDLQKELDDHSTTAVFSATAVRKTEQIEKLAREIRGLIRG